jgi:hypothetical protein
MPKPHNLNQNFRSERFCGISFPTHKMSLPSLPHLALLAAILTGCADNPPPSMGPEQSKIDLRPPAEVTGDVFTQWRNARRGTRQAEPQNNPYWMWIQQSGTSAFSANQHFLGPSSYGGKPAWEASRFGQSRTSLPDGSMVFIAGEHEDHYDPDFFIYNDVIIEHPDGQIDFLGYPTDDFPPTDFHSATLVDSKIIIIGNLGYPEDRKPDTTPILTLDTETWKVSKQTSSGDNPGWIHRHLAELSQDKNSILITGGLINPADLELPLVENIDDWRLHLADWRWERLTKRNWPLFEITRVDDEPNQLWEMRQAVWELENGKIDLAEAYKTLGQDIDPETLEMLEEATDYPPPKDRKALETLYQPDKVTHQIIAPPVFDDEEEEDDASEFGVTRIEVDGVTVCYVEDSYNILLTVEGELAKETIDALLDDLTQKLTKTDENEYRATQLRRP